MNPNRLALFAHFDAQDQVKRYVVEYLAQLRTVCERVVFVSTSRLAAPEGMADLLTGLQKAGTRMVLATFSNPYIAQELPVSSTYLVAWGGSPVVQRAAARALLGLAPITGQLPITIPSVAPYGTGIRRDALPVSAPPAPTVTP